MRSLKPVEVVTFVEKYYEMKPEFEELIWNGRELRNGMTVLLGSPDLRIEIEHEMYNDDLDRAKECNRWCEIGGVELAGNRVTFIATYLDQTQRKRFVPIEAPWLVKSDSIPGNPLREEIKRIILDDSFTETPFSADELADRIMIAVHSFEG